MIDIKPVYQVRYEYVFEGESYGACTAKVGFPTLLDAQTYASQVKDENWETLEKRHPDFRYLQSGVTIWCVYHHEERI